MAQMHEDDIVMLGGGIVVEGDRTRVTGDGMLEARHRVVTRAPRDQGRRRPLDGFPEGALHDGLALQRRLPRQLQGATLTTRSTAAGHDTELFSALAQAKTETIDLLRAGCAGGLARCGAAADRLLPARRPFRASSGARASPLRPVPRSPGRAAEVPRIVSTLRATRGGTQGPLREGSTPLQLSASSPLARSGRRAPPARLAVRSMRPLRCSSRFGFHGIS